MDGRGKRYFYYFQAFYRPKDVKPYLLFCQDVYEHTGGVLILEDLHDVWPRVGEWIKEEYKVEAQYIRDEIRKTHEPFRREWRRLRPGVADLLPEHRHRYSRVWATVQSERALGIVDPDVSDIDHFNMVLQ